MGEFYKKGEIVPEGQGTWIKLQGYPCLEIINESRWHMAGVIVRKKSRKSLLKPYQEE